jgi:hypothetical protein
VNVANFSNNGKRIPLLLGFLVLAFLPLSFSVTFFDTYFYGDTVHFTSCSNTTIRANCYLGNFVSSPWNESCSVYALDSSLFYCKHPVLIQGATSYDVPIDTTIYPLLEYIYTPYDVSNPKNLTKSLLIHKFLRENGNVLFNQSILQKNTGNIAYVAEEDVLLKLRDLRNDSGKCWPKQGCSLKQTVDVLYELHLAGYNTSNRVYQDALLYVSARQIKASPNITLEIKASEEAICDLRKGSSSFKQITFVSQYETLSLALDATQVLNVTCDTSFSLTMYDIDYNIITKGNSDYYENDDETIQYDFFTYTPKAGCIPYKETVWDNCDFVTTSKFLLLQGITSQDYALGKKVIESSLQQQRVGKRLSSTDDILANIYAYAVTRNRDLYTWILFNQKNGGSFNFGAEPTLEALRLLNESNEWTIDARTWLSSNKGVAGWNDVYVDTLTYVLFETNTSSVQTNPSLLATQTDRLRFTLNTKNKTISDTTIQLLSKEDQLRFGSSGLTTESMTYNYTNETGIFLLKAKDDGLYNGVLFIDERLFVPVVFSRQPVIELHIEDMYYVTQEIGYISLRVKPSSSLKTCTFNFESNFIDTVSDVTKGEVTFEYEFDTFGEYSVPLTYICEGSYKEIKGNDIVYITFEKTAPISIKTSGKGTQKSPYVVTIKNNLERDITLNLAWSATIPTHDIPPTIELLRGQKAELKILQTAPTNLAQIREVNLLIQTLGFQAEVPLILDIVEEIFPLKDELEQVVVKDATNWRLILLIVGGFLLIAVMMWYLFLKNTQLGVKQGAPEPQTLQTPSTAENLKIVVPDKKHAGRAVEVFIELKRSLGKTDAEIVQDLVKSGYAEEEVLIVLEDLNKLEGKDTRVTGQSKPMSQGSSPSTQSSQSNQQSSKPADSKLDSKSTLEDLAKQIQQAASQPKPPEKK